MKCNSVYSDEYLLVLFKSGDKVAYRMIYERYWELLFRFAKKLLGEQILAEDVVQEVFTTFWLKGSDLTEDMPLAPYLYKLTRNKTLDLIRHAHVRDRYLNYVDYVVIHEHDLPDTLLMERELSRLIEAEIKNLPEKMRHVFQLSRKEHKSNREIATTLGLSEQTVKNQISNALKVLRFRMGQIMNIFLMFF